jgi:HK97 family phage major capsid protein
MNAEENTQWDTINADIDALKATIDRAERQEANEKAESEVRSTGIGREDRVVKADTPDDKRKLAFRHYLRNGLEGMSADLHNALEYRALGEGSGAIGGYTVPQGFRAIIVDTLKSYVGPRQAPCDFITTDQGNDLPMPTGDDTGNVGILITENTQVTGSSGDPSFGQVLMKAYMWSSDVVLIPIQLIQDNGVDLDRYVGVKLGQRIGRVQNTYFTTGTGTGQPQGIVTGASTSGITAASAISVTYAELQAISHAIDPAYRVDKNRCGYMFNDSTLLACKKLVDSLGRPLWQAGMAASQPDTLNGWNYYINQGMASMASGTKAVLFANFSYYCIRDVAGAGMLVLKERYADYFQQGYLAWLRSDAKVTNSGAIKYLTMAASS